MENILQPWVYIKLWQNNNHEAVKKILQNIFYALYYIHMYVLCACIYIYLFIYYYYIIARS